LDWSPVELELEVLGILLNWLLVELEVLGFFLNWSLVDIDILVKQAVTNHAIKLCLALAFGVDN